MATRKIGRPRKVTEKADFSTLIMLVPTDKFVRMVSSSGLLPWQSRALCAAFKEMKT